MNWPKFILDALILVALGVGAITASRWSRQKNKELAKKGDPNQVEALRRAWKEDRSSLGDAFYAGSLGPDAEFLAKVLVVLVMAFVIVLVITMIMGVLS